MIGAVRQEIEIMAQFGFHSQVLHPITSVCHRVSFNIANEYCGLSLWEDGCAEASIYLCKNHEGQSLQANSIIMIMIMIIITIITIIIENVNCLKPAQIG